MATMTIVTDDLGGTGEATTTTFTVDGRTYTIDLNAENTEALRSALAPFVDAATEVKGEAPKTKVKSTSKPSGEAAKVRTWARENGFQVGDRGRLDQKIVDAYRAAQVPAGTPDAE